METYPGWIRLHPVATDETLATAVQAQMHDPLWLLGRQWQFGELRHDAGATPVDVAIEGRSAPITRLRGGAPGGGGSAAKVSTARVPLEALVEREPVPERGLDNLRLRTESGQHLLRLLRAAGLGARTGFWVDACPFPAAADTPAAGGADARTREWLALVRGRVPDGAALPPAIRQRLAAGATPPIAAGEAAVLRAWLAWAATRFDVPAGGPSTWDPTHLEYAFAVAAPDSAGERVLAAPEYTEGRLDWYAFEQADAAAALGATGATTVRRAHRIPAPLDFAGMPNPRFWTFEDPGVRFEALEMLSDPQGPPAPPTLLVLDFALGYSDDWFLVPLSLDAWSVFEAGTVAVTDVFGDRHLAQPPGGRWNLFRLDAAGPAPGLSRWVVVADPALPVEGPPIEELHLLRDEVANVAWAVEARVPHPVGGADASVPGPAAPSTPGPPTPAGGLTWTLAPPPPPGRWLPLLPVALGQLALGTLWFARGARPAGVMLGGLRGTTRLRQHEVPPSGVQLDRRWQSARALDGSVHWWLGRSKSARQTDIAPLARFDTVDWR